MIQCSSDVAATALFATCMFTCLLQASFSTFHIFWSLCCCLLCRRWVMSNSCMHSSHLHRYDCLEEKVKVNVNLYSTSSRTPLMSSDMEQTLLPANNTISAFNCKHSPGGATTHSECLSSTYYSFIDHKRMNGRVGWHTADCLPRGGHPLTARHGAGQGMFASHRSTF